MSAPDVDRNLLFGVLALQLGLIDNDQFRDVCAGWAVRMDEPLAELLVERGWISAEDRAAVEWTIERKLKQFQGDVRASLGAVAEGAARDAIRAVDHPELRKSLSSLPPARGYVLVETLPLPGPTQQQSRYARSQQSRYALSRLHAQGGLGKVWVARDTDLNRDVALKEVRMDRVQANPELWRRFLKEAQITGQLEHPNIVPVYELAHRPEDDMPFYTMRFVRGRTLMQEAVELHERRKDRGGDPVEFARLLQAFVGVCNAVAYAHSRGVVHRDLKPENVVLGGFGEVVVLDWGLAKLVDAIESGDPDPARVALTAESQTQQTVGQVGTPAYMAPEQAEGNNDLVDNRTDVYGLGAILYTILTGKPPWDGTNSAEVMKRILGTETPRARAVEPTTPKPLDAICAQAMAKERSRRYAGAANLARDVERHLAGESVSAYRDPWTVRAGRWIKRHRTSVATAAAVLVVALAAGAYILAERQSRGRSLAQAVLNAQIASVPSLIGDLQGYRFWADPPLKQALAETDRPDRTLRAALALFPTHPDQADFLIERVLAAEPAEARMTPEELLVVRGLLRDQLPRHAQRLWSVVDDPATSIHARLRAAALLADESRAADGRWTTHAPALADQLIQENVKDVRSWSEAFRAVGEALVLRLALAFNDLARTPAERSIAADLLRDYAHAPHGLVEVIQRADPRQSTFYLERLRKVIDQAVPLLQTVVGEKPAPYAQRETQARLQSQAAVALAQLGAIDTFASILKTSPDPTARTWTIDNLARLNCDPVILMDRLAPERDIGVRRALIQALGRYTPDRLPADRKQQLSQRLIAWYAEDPDPGIHSSIDWLLRRKVGNWGLKDELDRRDQRLAGRQRRDRDWFVNGQGQTYAVVRGPVEFTIGSPEDELRRLPLEKQARKRIGRSFAIATREVSMAEYGRFLDEVNRAGSAETIQDLRNNQEFRAMVPSDECPMTAVDWYEAARYCNWLSQKEGWPESEWCYPRPIGPGMTLDVALLERKGYRLPTEAEWEFACRAGAGTEYPHGVGAALLERRAWFDANSRDQAHPVGLLLPNELGLFDVSGNALEWTTHPYSRSHAAGEDSVAVDQIDDDDAFPLRGGGFNDPAGSVRCALRNAYHPSGRGSTVGFRPARTYP